MSLIIILPMGYDQKDNFICSQVKTKQRYTSISRNVITFDTCTGIKFDKIINVQSIKMNITKGHYEDGVTVLVICISSECALYLYHIL